MQIRWCWRCKIEIPMLDDEEIKLCHEAITGGKETVLREAKKKKITYSKWIGDLNKMQEPRRYYIDMFRMLTGFDEINQNAIAHHVISQYGPDCPKCSKPIRTPTARYCAKCGFGKEDFTSEKTRPLIERKAWLFSQY